MVVKIVPAIQFVRFHTYQKKINAKYFPCDFVWVTTKYFVYLEYILESRRLQMCSFIFDADKAELNI